MITFNGAEDFLIKEGQELGCSDWFKIDQEKINQFADATLDYQWIHTKPEIASIKSPIHKTIVHGYFTLSLIPYMLNQIIEVNNLDHLVNYRIEKLVFKNLVPVDSSVRLKATLKKAKDLGSICQAHIYCEMEIEGQETPAFETTIIFLYYFNQ